MMRFSLGAATCCCCCCWSLLLLGAVALPDRWDCTDKRAWHWIRFHAMGVSEPSTGLPEFSVLVYLDDLLFVYYDSTTRKVLPRVSWIQKVANDDIYYWERNTQGARVAELEFSVHLRMVRTFYNQSRGLHTIQWMYGCGLTEDGRKQGHFQFGYNGRDFITFDKETLTWTAVDATAQMSKRKWENDLTFSHYRKAYLEGECIEWLQQHLCYGKEALNQTESPMVKVTRKDGYEGLETLMCQIYGFYPREIEANWRKDGEILEHKTFRGGISPNLDGTYHTWLSIEIDPQDRGLYRCHVEHNSLPKALDVAWKNPVPVTRIVVGVLVTLVVVGVVAILVIKKWRGRLPYEAASSSEQGTASSSRA